MATLAPGVAEVLRRFGSAYLHTHALSTAQAKAWRGIVACRTAALGGQQLSCDTCGHSHWQYHSCRNRHFPQCGARAKDAWLQGRLAEVLPVPYAHLVFTLPHSLNALYGAHPRWVIDTLFACTAQTRYRQPDEPCTVSVLDDGTLAVQFERAQRAVTPGQSLVLYDGEVCLGGAVIATTDAPVPGNCA